MTEQEYIQYVERCRPRLVELARIYVGEPDDAEDIVQDVLVKLWTIHNTIPSFEAIAFAATKNKAIDFLRRRQRHQGSYIDIETLNAELEQVDDTDSRMLSIYEGSYVIVDGQRIDDLSLIHDDIVATLAFAQQTEDNIYSQSDIIDAQDDALNSITDEVERERIKQLLADIY